MEFPHSWRRLVALGVRSLLAAMVLVLWVGASQAVQAADIEVNSVSDNTLDDEFCTLREAIMHAQGSGNGDCTVGDSGADRIAFAPGLGASPVITLTAGQLPLIESELTISGTVTVDANQLSRHFQITSTGALTLDGLILVNGKVGNTAGNNETGGAIYNAGGRLTLINTDILSNTAYRGGGFYSIGGQVSVSGGKIAGNTAGNIGGGFANYEGSGQVTLTNTLILSNTADGYGGGFYNWGQVTLISARILSNTSFNWGGGFYNYYGGQVTLTNTLILSNTARYGGGFYNESGQVSVNGGKIAGNTGDGYGGGFYNYYGSQVTLTNTLILSNTATNQGGGFYNEDGGEVTVSQSCIVGNSDVAVVDEGAGSTDARHNWWGAPTGPSINGPGYGDSVSKDVVFAPFLTAAPEGCPELAVPLELHKAVTPVGVLLPGQPVSYTLVVSNTSELTLTDVSLVDQVPAGFAVQETIPPAQEGPSWSLGELGPGEVVTVEVRGVVSSTLSSDRTITNTAVLSSPVLAEPVTSEAHSPVEVSRLSWAASSASALESSGSLSLSVQLQPVNPYATVTVVYASQDGSAIAGSDYLTASGVLTFAPGVSEQVVMVTLVDDEQLEATEHFTLTLSNPQGASLDLAQVGVEVLDDDSGLSVGPSELAQLEGNSGSTLYRYVLTRTGYLTREAAVSYTVTGGAGVDGNDITVGQPLSGTVAWAVDEITQTLVITVAGDTLLEADEVFTVTLSNPQGAQLLNDTATGVIVNDDQASLRVEVENPAQAAAVGQVSAVTFTVSLSGSVDVSVTVDYATQDGTATAGEDYSPVSGTLPFSGQSGEIRPVVVAVNPERSGQPAEHFSLVLSNVQAQGRSVTLVNQGVAGVTLPDVPGTPEEPQEPEEPGETEQRLFLPVIQP